jgi:thioredoxin 1
MNKAMRIVIVVVLVAVVGTIFALKQTNKVPVSEPVASASPAQVAENNPVNVENPKSTEASVALPHFVDLGAGKCIPCKMMKPILDEFQVTFIDVWENPDEAKKSGIRVIPTQIFYDASGKELFRHEGFFSKEEILAKWNEFGVDLGEPK